MHWPRLYGLIQGYKNAFSNDAGGRLALMPSLGIPKPAVSVTQIPAQGPSAAELFSYVIRSTTNWTSRRSIDFEQKQLKRVNPEGTARCRMLHTTRVTRVCANNSACYITFVIFGEMLYIYTPYKMMQCRNTYSSLKKSLK